MIFPKKSIRGRGRCLSRGFDFFAVRFLAGFPDIDAALEEGPVFDGDAGGHDVTGERTVAADINPVAGSEVAAHFSQDNDFAALMLAETTPLRPT